MASLIGRPVDSAGGCWFNQIEEFLYINYTIETAFQFVLIVAGAAAPSLHRPQSPRRLAKGCLTMRILLNILGLIFILSGGVWFLQGINILPGSFMTGQPQWAVYGALAIVVGIGLLALANRGRAAPRR